MPCYRCGTRQADPGRGSRMWVRGVRAAQQVLVCPECQQTRGWSDDLDKCETCGATTLVRRLGQTVCRSCEASATAEFLAIESTIDTGAGRSGGNGYGGGRHKRRDSNPDLAAEVATAIDEILGKHRRTSDTERAVPEPRSDADGA